MKIKIERWIKRYSFVLTKLFTNIPLMQLEYSQCIQVFCEGASIHEA